MFIDSGSDKATNPILWATEKHRAPDGANILLNASRSINIVPLRGGGGLRLES